METALEISIFICLLSLSLEDLRYLAVSNYKLLLLVGISLLLSALRSSSLLTFVWSLLPSFLVLLLIPAICFYEFKRKRQVIGAGDLLLLAALLPAWSYGQSLRFLICLACCSAFMAICLLIFNLVKKKAGNAWQQRFPLIPCYLLAYILCQLL
ncbi:MAG: prepilin peptidase [Eubacteriales bacterium]|nr:prepilin peptidase [Eubacteriales bacterium]